MSTGTIGQSRHRPLQSSSARPDQYTTCSIWMRGVASTLSSQGLDAAALFTEAGLSIADLDDLDRRWPTENTSRLWALATERSGNPAVALADPCLARPDLYSFIGYTMMSSPDLNTGLGRLTRYHRLISDAATMTLDETTGGRWVRLEVFGGQYPVPRQRYEFGLLTLLRFCGWMLGRPFTPVAAESTFPEPILRAPYDEAFRCPLRFDGAINAFLVSNEDLARKLPTAAPELAEFHARVADHALLKLEGNGIAYRAREAVARHLQDGARTRAAVAADLSLSERTFQRRLAEEGLSFTRLVDETRRELTQHHLANPRLAISEIVHLLGYSDPSTFFRACQRWFGESPSEYRRRLLITK
jgi:AraC-like DNA-binding protein